MTLSFAASILIKATLTIAVALVAVRAARLTRAGGYWYKTYHDKA